MMTDHKESGANKEDLTHLLYKPDLDLHWHALNYRTAATVHAHAAWLELEACVGRLIEREREACAALAERGDDGEFSGSEFDFEARRGRDIAIAIRNRRRGDGGCNGDGC